MTRLGNIRDRSEILPAATPGMASYVKWIATGLGRVDYIENYKITKLELTKLNGIQLASNSLLKYRKQEITYQRKYSPV